MFTILYISAIGIIATLLQNHWIVRFIIMTQKILWRKARAVPLFEEWTWIK